MFVPRKQSAKRRVRRHLEEPEKSTSASPVPQTLLKASSVSAQLTNVPPSKSSRIRLRPTPDVPGYERPKSPNPNNGATSRYSREQLQILRLSTEIVTSLPVVSTAEPTTSAPLASFSESSFRLSPQPNLSESMARAVDDDPPPPDPSHIIRQPVVKASEPMKPSFALPEPFSKEWMQPVVDDASSSDHPLAQEDAPVVLMKSGKSDGEDSNSDVDSEQAREDGLWQRQLLQRAGINSATTSRLTQSEGDRQDEHIIREMHLQGKIPPVEGTLENILKEVEDHYKRSECDAEEWSEKAVRLFCVVRETKKLLENVRERAQKDFEVVKFYESLATDVESLCMSLCRHREKMVLIRERRIAKYRERGARMEKFLQCGADEFGRTRRAGCGPRWLQENDSREKEEVDEDLKEIVNDMPSKLRNVGNVIARFSEWRELLDKDYRSVLGDVGMGRLVGALATCEPHLEWVLQVNDEQLCEAMSVVNVLEEVEVFVEAEWRPSDMNNCESVGKIVGNVVQAAGDVGKIKVLGALKRRLEWDLGASTAIGDSDWEHEALAGWKQLSQTAGIVVDVECNTKNISGAKEDPETPFGS